MNIPETRDVELARQQAGKAFKAASALEVNDAVSFAKAGELLKKVVHAKRIVKLTKDGFTRPAREIIAQTKELFGPIERDVEAAEYMLKDMMKRWERQIEQLRQEQAAKLEARVEKGTMRFDTAVCKASELETVDMVSAGVSKSMNRVVRIVDKSLIPTQYYVIDMVAIRRDALGNKSQGIEPIEIAGVVVEEESNLSVR